MHLELIHRGVEQSVNQPFGLKAQSLARRPQSVLGLDSERRLASGALVREWVCKYDTVTENYFLFAWATLTSELGIFLWININTSCIYIYISIFFVATELSSDADL